MCPSDAAAERATTDGAVPASPSWNDSEPSLLVFDVNETLLDLTSMSPLFERVFGDPRVLREWFGQLVTYSMTVTLSGLYEDFFSLGRGVFRMVGDIHGVEVTGRDVDDLERGMRTMPAHPDVEEGLRALRDAGFRMVTLTNSPATSDAGSPLDNAGLADFFERPFSIGTTRSYKPAACNYHMVAREMAVPPSACMMVAAHVWDIMGAQSAGFSAGLVTRPGNPPLTLRGLPRPSVVAPDIPGLAERLIQRRR
jgi:2-haloacid dehalogenase